MPVISSFPFAHNRFFNERTNKNIKTNQKNKSENVLYNHEYNKQKKIQQEKIQQEKLKHKKLQQEKLKEQKKYLSNIKTSKITKKKI